MIPTKTLIEPLAGYITVRPILRKKEGNLYLPEGSQAQQTMGDMLLRAEVVAVTKYSPVEVGDIVRFLPQSGYIVKQDDEDLIIMKEEYLLAIERHVVEVD